MGEAEGHLYIVTHTDLDGVGAAAAAMVAFSRRPGEATIFYAEPYNVHERLAEVAEYAGAGDIVVVADLGPNRDAFPQAVEAVRRITSAGARVYWYDHHVWDPGEEEALRSAGAVIVIDRSTCATGVVARHAPGHAGTEPPGFLSELEAAVCAADLWRWDHPLAPKLYRVAEARVEGVSREEWRDRMAAKFSEGKLWDDEMEARLQDYISLELANYNRVLSTAYVAEEKGCRVAAAYKERGPPSNSFVAASLLARFEAHVAVIARGNGGLSLRSRGVDVRRIAVLLGGGGHPVAAGAKVSYPVTVRIAARLTKRVISRHAARLVLKKALEAGVCGGRGG